MPNPHLFPEDGPDLNLVLGAPGRKGPTPSVRPLSIGLLLLNLHLHSVAEDRENGCMR